MTASSNDKSLLGRTILLTRPLHQCASLAVGIRQQGGRCQILPMLTIELLPERVLRPAIFTLLQPQVMAIFLSANAVAAVQSLLPIALMDTLTCIAIGTATAKALAAAGLSKVLIPQQHNSEGILQMPCLQQIHHCHIVIFCGENPRPLLTQVLRQRQAVVNTVFCYKRQPIQYSETVLANALSEIDSVVCTSLEGLQQLLMQLSFDMLTMLGRCRLIVISERLAAYAREFNLHPEIALDADDEAILQALK